MKRMRDGGSGMERENVQDGEERQERSAPGEAEII